MAIKTSELTQMIAEQVTKEISKKLVPKLRRIVREEIDRSIKDMLYEMVIKQQIPLRNNNVIEDNTVPTLQFNEETQPENVSSAKNFIAQRQASKAKAQQLLESKFKSDDPFSSLIMDVEDPQEELDIQQEHIMSAPMKDVGEVTAGDVTMPENIDYSEHMNRLVPE